MEILTESVITTSQQDPDKPTENFKTDVLTGLNQVPKRLSSIYFYNEQGSKIFEQICTLDEYYLTRKETEILQRSAHDIIGTLPHNTHLIELGSGSSTKTRILLEAALAQFDQTRYSPIDISSEMLTQSANELSHRYPQLQIEALAGRYETGLAHFLTQTERPNCIMWLGSSIGNLNRRDAASFLMEIRQNINPDDTLLLGIDLRKNAQILEAAYDDASGVTAAFNLNLLQRINSELGGDFQIESFHHQAVYNAPEGRIEMYLVSDLQQEIYIDALETSISFEQNEKILTEYSTKYSNTEIRSLAESSGFILDQQWMDQESWFSLNLFRPDHNPLETQLS